MFRSVVERQSEIVGEARPHARPSGAAESFPDERPVDRSAVALDSQNPSRAGTDIACYSRSRLARTSFIRR